MPGRDMEGFQPWPDGYARIGLHYRAGKHARHTAKKRARQKSNCTVQVLPFPVMLGGSETSRSQKELLTCQSG
ncbi:MAG: hypothetical protein LBR26_17335 [Prevotella sp.]|nr:hypothetical protein [Prevotella sp.]